MDVISDLPIDVLDSILVRMPLKDAVRTSILARKWRDKWANISELVFTDECLFTTFREASPAEAVRELVSIVNQVLLRHQGSLEKFVFISSVPRFSGMDQWLVYLSIRGVKELIIRSIRALDEASYYEVSSRIFCCKEIRSLGLHHCIVRLPPLSEFFPNLKSLDLSQLVWAKGDLNTMISKCPLLERLKIKLFGDSVISLKINALNLKLLDLSCNIANLHFENAPVLSEMHIGTVYGSSNRVVPNSSFLPSLCHLPNIRKLALGNKGIMCLFPVRHVPRTLPTALCNLENLTVVVDFEDNKDILALVCMLRSSPRLQKLSVHSVCSDRRRSRQITRGPPLPPEYWQDAKKLDCFLNNLLEASISGMGGLAPELEFIRVVLARSPVLRKMTIRESREHPKIFKYLFRFRRASAEAEILWI